MKPETARADMRLSLDCRMDSLTLAELERDRPGEIIRVDGEGSLVQRLMALGFLPGGEVRVVQVAPLGDPIAVELNGWRVSLRREEASLIEVKTS